MFLKVFSFVGKHYSSMRAVLIYSLPEEGNSPSLLIVVIHIRRRMFLNTAVFRSIETSRDDRCPTAVRWSIILMTEVFVKTISTFYF